MIFDTHSHYNLPPFEDSWESLWKNARKAGVAKSIIVGVDMTTSQTAIDISTQDQDLYATVGLHPSEASTWNDNIETNVRKISTHPKVVAIGETGLDFARVQPNELPLICEQQIKVFKKHIEIARDTQKTLIIHARDAYDDVLKILQEEELPESIVLHCMSGTLEYQKEALALGCYCSFAGNVTYPSAEHIRKLALNTPLDKLLIETDAPFLPPQSKRGQVNAPENILETAEYLARIFHSTIDDICAQTYQNACTCFRLE